MKAKAVLLISLLALMCSFGARAYVYHNQTTKVTHFDYSGFTYTYTDANGVEQTARLTDEATSTEQIVALLKEVYVNRNIPGIHYGYDFNGMQSRKIDYNFCGHQGASATAGFPWQRPAAGEVFPNPDQDGMTMLLVTISDNWKVSYASTDPIEYISRCYTSARLMTNFTRVNDSNNPGYIMQVNDVNTNRFFFISKGKPRSSYTRPLYRLYEQISPVKGDDGQITNDFITEMRAGNPYLVYHDCSEMGTIGGAGTPHWFTISNNGENFNLSNLTIFIPDRRFEPQHDPEGVVKDNISGITYNGKRYFVDYGDSNDPDESKWHKDIMPKVLMYIVNLEAKATPSETDGYYDINLNWDTNFTFENLNVDVPQHFYVYILDGNNRVKLATVVDQPTTAREHTYSVEQTIDPQTFSYIVTAHPINYDNNGNMLLDDEGNPLITVSAESQVRTVTIPGRHSAFFIQAQEYRSRYEATGVNSQYNVYKNKMSIHPSSYDDYLSIKNDEHAYEVVRTDADGNRSVVAQVQFTFEPDTQVYNYTVTYNADSQVTDPVFDDEEPVTSGQLTGFDNSTVIVIDRFLASTKNNDHSDHYVYTFEQLSDDDEAELCSNSFTVPVFKTTNAVGGEEHTHEEVVADTDHSAKAIPSNTITFSALTDPTANLTEYDIFRADYQLKKLTKIGKAERTNNFDRYSLYSAGENGMINDFLGTVSVSDDNPNITLLDYNNKDYNQQSLYVPVITALYNGDASKPNTYGCDFKTMYYPQLELKITNQVKSDPFNGPTGMLMGYLTEMQLTPKIPNQNDMTAYYYRVWRVMEGDTQLDGESLLNDAEDLSAEYWATCYYPIKETFPQGNPLVNDIFVDYPFYGSKKYVTYIARLYATTLSPDEAPEMGTTTQSLPRRSPSASGKDYFIAEAKKRVFFDESIITAIDDVNVDDAEVADVTYYNVLGMPSKRPYTGMNIVETRYTNGMVKTAKVIR